VRLRRYFQWQSNRGKRHLFFARISVSLYGVLAWLAIHLLPSKGEKEVVDVLILYRDSTLKRSFVQLTEALAPLRVAERPLPKEKKVISTLSVARFLRPVALDYFIYAAYAAYIANYFRPRVVIFDENGSRYAPFLREAVNEYGGLTVHLPHSIPTANYRKFNLIDYDYSFVFGMSSVDSLRALPNLYGETTCVITGPLFAEGFKGETQEASGYSVTSEVAILLGSGPSYESGSAADIYRMMILWALEKPGRMVYFKPHPRSDLLAWSGLVDSLEADCVVKTVSSMEELDGVRAHFAVAGFTNAVIDIANKGVPIIWVADTEEADFFSQEAYFLPRVPHNNDFPKRIEQMLASNEHYHQRALDFAAYHLGKERSPVKKMAETVKRLVKAEEPVEGYLVSSKLK